jgi:hypothetical protein
MNRAGIERVGTSTRSKLFLRSTLATKNSDTGNPTPASNPGLVYLYSPLRAPLISGLQYNIQYEIVFYFYYKMEQVKGTGKVQDKRQ